MTRQNIGGLEVIDDFLDWQNEEQSRFPTITPEAIPVIEELGYGKLGYAFGITDPTGQIYTYKHKAKPSNGVADGQWGIPSETVKGEFSDDDLVRIETYEECLVRCLLEEQAINLREAPPEAQLLIDRELPISIIDWNMSHDTRDTTIKHTFGVAIAVTANQAMAEFMSSNGKETREAYKGVFQPDCFLQGLSLEQTRPAFDAWLAQHLANFVRVDEIDEVPITIPPAPVTGDWVSLRFSSLYHRGLIARSRRHD